MGYLDGNKHKIYVVFFDKTVLLVGIENWKGTILKVYEIYIGLYDG